jgi:hypothetical protein
MSVVGNLTSGAPSKPHYGFTANWCAPEQLAEETENDRIQPPVDVYSYGLLCYLVRIMQALDESINR